MPVFSQVYHYSVASTNEAAFIIGGHSSADIISDIIAQFKDNAWSLNGNLQKPRSNQASITSGDMTMIIGGKTNDER